MGGRERSREEEGAGKDGSGLGGERQGRLGGVGDTGPRRLGRKEWAPGAAQGLLRLLWPMPRPMGNSAGRLRSRSY